MNSIIRVIGIIVAQVAFATSAYASMPLEGKTAQPIGHYDFCKRYSDQCGPNDVTGLIRLTGDVRNELVQVNDAVNLAVFPMTDMDTFGVEEFWTYPKSQGDCEDYALLKQYMLERAGFPRSALLLTVLRQRSGEGHAVLTVTTDKGDLVLDNLVDEVKDWRSTEYTYLKRQSAENSAVWIAITDERDLPVASLRK